jgi:hypothetical protein
MSFRPFAGGWPWRAGSALLALQDGSTIRIGAGRLRPRACFAVRRMSGTRGFAWLRLVDASPPPGPGQLTWPIDRSDCFSAAPLASLGR